MFARTVVVVCLLGLIGFGDNCRAQSDNDRSKQQLLSSYLYSVLHGQKGDKTTFRDSSGRTQGSAIQSNNRITIRDGSGRSIGSAETSGNKTIFRDASGRSIGSASSMWRSFFMADSISSVWQPIKDLATESVRALIHVNGTNDSEIGGDCLLLPMLVVLVQLQ